MTARPAPSIASPVPAPAASPHADALQLAARRGALLIGLLVGAALPGCGGDAPATPLGETVAPAAPPAEPNYSPFVVDLHGTSPAALPFHLISFKDVGMSLPDDAARQLAYESLAEALSLELRDLSSELGADMVSSVRHDQRIADPSAHLACEGGHLYVDVWRSGQDGPYGYSLWSGCGEDDRFAYNEQVPLATATRDGTAGPGPAAPPSMDPLAEEIAESLEGALRRRCFQRAC